MALADQFQSETDKALDAMASAPPAPPVVRQPTRSAWGAIPRGLAAAGAEVFSQVTAGNPNEGMRQARAADDPIQIERDASAAKNAAMSVQSGDYARSLRPDPATASTAENVVFGLSRGLGKAVGSVVALGPAGGAAAFGASEAGVTYEDLTRQGVDPATAGKAAAVSGVVNAASVVLPMAGPTLKATAGLYLAGGPGAFMAQQAATRAILERADYGELAKQYDPLDPLGLALSTLIPLPFAAHGARAVIKAREAGAAKPAAAVESAAPALSREAVDAVMTHNLTLARDLSEARAAEVLPRAGEVVPIQSLADFAAQRGVKPPKPETAGPDPFLAWLREQGGVSSAEKFDITGERSGLSRVAIFRREGLGLDELARRAEADGFLPPGSVEAATDNGGTRALADLVQRAAAGERIRTVMDQAQHDYTQRQIADVQGQVQALETRLHMLGEDPTAAHGDLMTLEAYMARHEERLIGARMAEIADQQRLLDAVPPEPKKVKPPPPEIDDARQALQDIADSGRDVADYLDGASGLSPAAKNLVIGLHETAGNAARADALLGDFARTVEARPGAKPVDIAADVVEAARAGGEVTPAPAKPDGKPPTPEQAAAESIAARVAEVEAVDPGLAVGQDANGKTVTAAELMDQARREAEFGTDAELGAADADLVRVAADCALSSAAL